MKKNETFKMAFDRLLGYANLCKMRMANVDSCPLVTLLDLVHSLGFYLKLVPCLLLLQLAPLIFIGLIVISPLLWLSITALIIGGLVYYLDREQTKRVMSQYSIKPS